MTPDAPERPLRDAALLALLAAFLLAPSFFTRDLWAPDETRYMEVARAMAVTGDYLMPRINGQIYAEKPPMFFWLAAGLYKLGAGLNAGRLLAALASAGTVLLTWGMARRFLPSPGPLIAGLTTLTCLLFLSAAHMGVLDPLLTFFITGAICCGLRAFEGRESNFDLYWLGAYAFAAAAVLTKGPVGLAVPLVALTVHGIVERPSIRKGGWIHLAGALMLLALVGTWLLPALQAGGPEYRDHLLFEQIRTRVTTGEFITPHQAPVYHYLILLPVALFPWTLLFAPAFWAAVRARRRDAAARAGLAWFLSILIFFTLMAGKRIGYLLPLAPGFGLLMGRYLGMGAGQGAFPWPRAHRALAGVTLALFAGMGIALAIGALLAQPLVWSLFAGDPAMVSLAADLTHRHLGAMSLLAVVLAALAWAGWRAGIVRQKPLTCVIMIFLAVGALSLAADVAILTRINAIKSGRSFAVHTRSHVQGANEAYQYRKHFGGEFNLYTRRLTLPRLDAPEELAAALARPGKVAVIARAKDVADALGDPPRIGRIVIRGTVRGREMMVLTNWGEAPQGGTAEESRDE